jgi:hypothetical protein
VFYAFKIAQSGDFSNLIGILNRIFLKKIKNSPNNMSKIVLCRASVRRAGRKMRRHSSCKNSRSSKMSVRGCHVSLIAAHAESRLQSEGILINNFERCK